VHSGIPVELRQNPAPPLTLDPGKVYLAWATSDGVYFPALMDSNSPQL
jgi:hypothetical protein